MDWSYNKKHKGCALKGNLIKYVHNNLCLGSIREEHSKFYAIIIYLLIKNDIERIKSLTICNDEEFIYVKEYLMQLLGDKAGYFIIRNITEFREILGRKIKSPADNCANSYRKRGLNKKKWSNGKTLNVVEINFELIKEYWGRL
jgi:hypothetical protein